MTQERMEYYNKRMKDSESCMAYLEAIYSKDPHRIQATENALQFSDFLTMREFLLEIRQGRA